MGSTAGDPRNKLSICPEVASCGRSAVVATATAVLEVSWFVALERLDEGFLIPNVVSLIDGNAFEMALARGIEANRTSHNPQITLAKTMRIVYTSPRQITRPVNILVMGMANPIEAKKRGRKSDSTAGE
jgi:hypothetical protein